ncbi:MAG: hypothetical protein AB7J35_14735 [Dehalococcoidia bacterium]
MPTRFALPRFMLGVLALAFCGVVACSDNSGDTVVPTAAKSSGDNTLRISARDFTFVPSDWNAFNTQDLTIVLTNDGAEQHTLRVYEDSDYTEPVDDASIHPTDPGQSNQVTFTPPKEPRTLYFRCEIHPDLMQGEISIAATVN